MKQTTETEFVPMRLIPTSELGPSSTTKITATCTIKGDAADEFEAIMEKYQLNRSQLVLQMVYHCLGKSKELKDLYTRLQILAK